jgi:hypothetical protein
MCTSVYPLILILPTITADNRESTVLYLLLVTVS